MSLNPHLIPVRKDPEIIRNEVLTNCAKMFSERGFINKDNIKKIQSGFSKISDNDVYVFKLDKGIVPDNTSEDYLKKFNPNILAIKIIHQKILGIAKVPAVKEFLDEYNNCHKMFIFEGISDKAKSTILTIPNTEVFTEGFLMINLIEHIDSPKYEVLLEDEIKEVLESYIVKRKELPKILTTDPVVAYFNLKRGQIIRVIRCSEQSGYAIVYRIVAKGAN
jgi:DNA-directed RNA polymerase subunit H (RpoH/RPB5)